MPNILGHQGNINSNHSEFSSDSMAAVKKKQQVLVPDLSAGNSVSDHHT